MLKLNMDLYLKAFANSITHKGITGGTIHDFLRNSKVQYYGGKCPVWYWEYVFCRNRLKLHPITTKDKTKALKKDALVYFRSKFANHEFRLSK